MNDDNWKDYQKFKIIKPSAEAYYDLVRSVFLQGVEQVSNSLKFSNAIDLGCGSRIDPGSTQLHSPRYRSGFFSRANAYSSAGD